MSVVPRFEEKERRKRSYWETLLSGDIRTVPDFFERLCETYADRCCFIETGTGRSLTYGEVDSLANGFAGRALAADVRPGERVALLMHNCIEFFAACLGLAKIGAEAALINTSLEGDLLRAALGTAAPVRIVVADRFANRLFALRDHDGLLMPPPSPGDATTVAPDRHLRATASLRTPFVYIYTSGTTGRSKAAKFSHKRFIGAGVNWAVHAELDESTRYYIPLPLYHGNGGVVALASTMLVGGTAVLRETFSATAFWNDITTYRCTATIYIGELWRYLANAHGDKVESPLTTAMGNGLAPSLWPIVRERFGVRHIVEHFGATEMPGDAIVNSYGKDGSCGFLPPGHAGYALVLHDAESGLILRGPDGLALPAAPDQAGELLLALDDGQYDGYLDPAMTGDKLCRDILRHGDVWWRSGDILRRDAEGFFYFVDRLGDTFRWNGENTATTEVEQQLLRCPGVLEANAYGVKVPGRDGKACMVSLQVSPSFDWTLFEACAATLPKHARPRFVRLAPDENDKTATLKLKKHHLAAKGFGSGSTDVWLLELAAGTYRRLGQGELDAIQRGEWRL